MFHIRHQDNVIIEVFEPILIDGKQHDDPTPLFHPDVGWIAIDSEIEPREGDIFLDGTLYPKPSHATDFDMRQKKWNLSLDALKKEKVAAIDARTVRLIRSGFAFAGKRFSMSDAAQRNWIALSSDMANSLLPFPLTVSTIDESSHVLASADELKAFFGAYLLYQADPAQPLGAGRALKERLAAAATVEEVEAIADDRE